MDAHENVESHATVHVPYFLEYKPVRFINEVGPGLEFKPLPTGLCGCHISFKGPVRRVKTAILAISVRCPTILKHLSCGRRCAEQAATNFPGVFMRP